MPFEPSPSDLRVGTIGWFLFPDSYWSPGKIVDYDAFRAALLGPENASHDLIPKPEGYEAADTLVIFYPKSALSGWWTTKAIIHAGKAFQELEDVAIESITDSLDAATAEMVRMAYREASDERGERALPVTTPGKSPKRKSEIPRKTPEKTKRVQIVEKPTQSPQVSQKAVETTQKREFERKPIARPETKSAIPKENQIAHKPKQRTFLLSDASDDDDLPDGKPSQPKVSFQLPNVSPKRQSRPKREETASSESDTEESSSGESDSGESSSGDEDGLFLSKEERDRLFTSNYTREKRRKRSLSTARRQSSQMPRISFPKPKKQFFTTEMDWYISKQGDLDVQQILRRLQTAHREVVRNDLNSQLQFVQISELDFLRQARDELVAGKSADGEISKTLAEIAAKWEERAKKVLGTLPSLALRERARKMQWVLPDVENFAPPPVDERAVAAKTFQCRNIYKDDPLSDTEAPELFSAYNSYVKSIREGP